MRDARRRLKLQLKQRERVRQQRRATCAKVLCGQQRNVKREVPGQPEPSSSSDGSSTAFDDAPPPCAPSSVSVVWPQRCTSKSRSRHLIVRVRIPRICSGTAMLSRKSHATKISRLLNGKRGEKDDEGVDDDEDGDDSESHSPPSGSSCTRVSSAPQTHLEDAEEDDVSDVTNDDVAERVGDGDRERAAFDCCSSNADVPLNGAALSRRLRANEKADAPIAGSGGGCGAKPTVAFALSAGGVFGFELDDREGTRLCRSVAVAPSRFRRGASTSHSVSSAGCAEGGGDAGAGQPLRSDEAGHLHEAARVCETRGLLLLFACRQQLALVSASASAWPDDDDEEADEEPEDEDAEVDAALEEDAERDAGRETSG